MSILNTLANIGTGTADFFLHGGDIGYTADQNRNQAIAYSPEMQSYNQNLVSNALNIPLATQDQVATVNGNGAGTGGTTDPYAQWGGKAGYDAKVNAFNTQKTGVVDSAGRAGDAAGREYGSGVLDYLDTLTQGQHAIDTKATNAELAKRQGGRGVMDMVSQGLESGNTLLSSKNSTTSSASEALARAYSKIGQRQMNGVNGQYAEDQNAITEDQNNLNANVGQQRRHNEEYKVKAVNSIVDEASRGIDAINAAMAGASLPDRINMQAEIDSIRSRALSALQAHDQEFNQGVDRTKFIGADGARAKAAELDQAGTAAPTPYELTTEAPASFQDTGGFSGSNLPLFTLPRKRTA